MKVDSLFFFELSVTSFDYETVENGSYDFLIHLLPTFFLFFGLGNITFGPKSGSTETIRDAHLILHPGHFAVL